MAKKTDAGVEGREAVLNKKDLKTFLLDTNVLLHNHNAVFSFGKNEVVIPIIVLEELDRFKKYADEKGRHARALIRHLDRLRQKGNLKDGVLLDNGGVLRVGFHQPGFLPDAFEGGQADNQLLNNLLALQKDRPEVVLITKDINLRIKADVLGVKAQDYEKEKVQIEDLYHGWRPLPVSKEVLDRFFQEGLLKTEGLLKKGAVLNPNEGVALNTGDHQSGLGYYDKRESAVKKLVYGGGPVMGIRALNRGQHFAFNLLLDDRVQLVTILGSAGTGKTLLALAAALQKTVKENKYRRVLVARPVMPMGQDIGFLPGSKEEKLENWMQPIRDNLEFIFRTSKTGSPEQEKLFARQTIVMEALTYLRGRSIPDQIILVDEVQNLTPLEVKTIISRAGEGAKVILTGDPWQIDNPYLDSSSNGLSYAAERFRGQEIAGHIMLEQSERSTLAALAGKLL